MVPSNSNFLGNRRRNDEISDTVLRETLTVDYSTGVKSEKTKDKRVRLKSQKRSSGDREFSVWPLSTLAGAKNHQSG
eukprot:237586-Prorocentrum_minimum.AAC.1